MGHISFEIVTETTIPGGMDDYGQWDEYTERITTRLTAYYCDRCGSWLVAKLEPNADAVKNALGKQADVEQQMAGMQGEGRAGGCSALAVGGVALGTVLAMVYALSAGWRPVWIAVVVGIGLIALYLALSQVEDEKKSASRDQREARKEANSMWDIMHQKEIEARIQEQTQYHCQNCGHEWHSDDPKRPNPRGYTKEQYETWRESVAMGSAPFLFVERETVDVDRG